MAIISAPIYKRKSLPKTKLSTPRVDMSRTATIVLGGGQGTRLFPLTVSRCKPAICFGGRYRLIDVPVSNALNSDCNRIFIITQFLSSSLHRHILKTYQPSSCSLGFIELLAAEQKPTKNAWFQGTADAVRQNLPYFLETPADYFLILSGDQLYNLDFRYMVQKAEETDADLVIAALPVDEPTAKRMGVLKVNDQGSVTDFIEKPNEKRMFDQLRASPSHLEELDLPPGTKKNYLGSMGIYLFKRQALIDLLKKDPREDFGKHLIPSKVAEGKVSAYLFDDYWEDIGTIESFYQANISLTQKNPRFNYYIEQRPIYTSCSHLPSPKITNSKIEHSIICEGAQIDAEEIRNSIVGPRTMIGKDTLIQDSYLMGNDFYHPPVENSTLFPKELKIGKNCVIRGTILDRNVCIGDNVQLINKNNLTHYNGDQIYIRDGIIVVMRGATLPNHFIL